MNNKSFIICSNEGIFHFLNLTEANRTKIKKFMIYEKSYSAGIKIIENIIVLTSNSNLSNGEDKLIFCNIFSNKIIDKIEGYSFNLSKYSLSFISNDKNKEDTIILCACKKYEESQKNGILLVNFNKNKKCLKNYYFYDTNNFEVYCFLEIFFSYNLRFILVGGFDLEQKIGIIKLYGIIIKDIFGELEFEFLYFNDIEIEEFFENMGIITCLEQSNESKNILISTSDGNIYLSKINIDFKYFYENIMLFKKLEPKKNPHPDIWFKFFYFFLNKIIKSLLLNKIEKFLILKII